VAETKTHRCLGWPRRRHDPGSEDEEPDEVEPQPEDPREEENTEAVPVAVGEPVKSTGKGKKQKKHYASFEYHGNNFEMVSLLLLCFSLLDFRPQCRRGFRATGAALPMSRAATSCIPSPHLPSIPIFHLASRRQLKQSEQVERGRLLPPLGSHGRPRGEE
jgi:hypothetical protein